MKKSVPLFLFTLFMTSFIAFPTASAQGEWKWAHYWTGSGGDLNNVFNKITNTAFDEDGNMYVYGTMGGNARLDGEMLMFSDNSTVITTSEHSILLAKFDTLGTMLWYKVIKCNSDYWSFPKWMTVKNDRIYITGITGMWGDYDYWLYYIDTLITKADVLSLQASERKPPYKHSRWTFFSQLDLDGNRIEDHFVETYTRQYYENGNNIVRSVRPICTDEYANPTPMHIDNEGNTYLFAPFDYAGNEEDPYTVVIDGDSSNMYDLYLPGSSCGNSSLQNAMLYKFTPNWELDFAKLMVQNTEGIATSWELAHDSINPLYYVYPEWLSYDEEDNMYFSGFVTLGLSVFGAHLHQYPVRIYFDSLHYATISDQSGTRRVNFIIKYNTDGDILWCNQIYTKGHSDNSEEFSRGDLYGNCYYNNALYLTGRGCSVLDENLGIFFDSTCTMRLHGPQNISKTNVGFFVRYDATSGNYINYGVVPAIEGNSSASPGPVLAVINNRVFALSLYKQFSYDPAIIQWSTDGNFISHIPYSTGQSKLGAVNANHNGTLLVDLVAFSPVTFSNNVVADCNNQPNSHAVFALYHNPEWATPFVPDDTVAIDEYYQKRENSIYLYPNPTDGKTAVCGYLWDYQSAELFDLQGRKLDEYAAARNFDSGPVFDLTPYPAGTYIVKINFKRGVSVVRKVIKN
ncbi:MAG: T9SS type A sorting domain-containing protein [Bacteroidales bacterium]|nr:T9SS type A sorting domain-containing protein [Bacteroidales bacterium]